MRNYLKADRATEIHLVKEYTRYLFTSGKPFRVLNMSRANLSMQVRISRFSYALMTNSDCFFVINMRTYANQSHY